ncbi:MULTISPECIES: response regulator transcription factor [Clostridium]|uniref:response regulator transcription factor n=1 Tax=Clostridium TaxID=1485 RepID=UPI000825A0A3|nr:MULTISPECIES: response regulator transcription factor [Clostridium]PJI07697.1 DNA-binding response regulator [Clostridium sp. CT7]
MKLLIVEDDKELSRVLVKGLEKYEYVSDVAFDGEEGLYYIETNVYDAVILDINLPKIDGITLCRNIREKFINTPIIMLTARTDTEDKILGLDSGADDYLGKPFELKELSARLRALIRRNYNKSSNVVKIGNLTVNGEEKTVKVKDDIIELTAREYDILELLSYSYPNIVSAEKIIEHVWDSSTNEFTNVIRVHIANLRRKLKHKNGEELIETIKGRGYKICSK